MYKLIAITGVAEVRERNSKGLVCLVHTPKGVEQAVISCNGRLFNAASAVLEHVEKSIDDHQKKARPDSVRVRFLN